MLDTRTSLTLTRAIKAPPSRIFAAWTDPARMLQWWGPEGARVHHAEADPRVGGGFSVTFDTPDGGVHTSKGEYLDIVADERLVFTWEWVDASEHRSLVSVLLAPAEEGTILTLIHEKLENETSRDEHHEGWSGALARLAAEVETV